MKVEALTKHFPLEKGWIDKILTRKNPGVVHAVDGIDFHIKRGEIFGLVGESGSGKTTTGRLVLRLIEPTAGKILFDGRDIVTLDKKEIKKFRSETQIIFQDPFSSLNPRMTIENIVGESLVAQGMSEWKAKRKRVIELLEKVGLTPAHQFINRYPHEFSGGQRQRVGIARALTLNPKFIVADEPVSSLDASIKAQILNLMQDLKDEFELTYLWIDHDLPLVRYFCVRVAVMYLGKIVEIAKTEDLFENPQHPYTQALISSTPRLDPDAPRKIIPLKGEIGSPVNPPAGCRFHPRCPYAKPKCQEAEPEFRKIAEEHIVACHLAI